MLSEKQRLEKLERIKLEVDTFLSYDNICINELSTLIHKPSSTIQRDLNDVGFITEIYGDKAKEILKSISQKLKQNKANGLRTGGINSTTNNEPIRDDNGKFVGNRKR